LQIIGEKTASGTPSTAGKLTPHLSIRGNHDELKASRRCSLIDSGIPREELEQAVAKLYMETLRAKSSSQPDTVRDYHLDFARAILDRAFYRLEYITNGLNVSGKRTFCEVTMQLNANGAARKMLMEWAGIDPLQDAILEARRLVKVWYDSAARQLGNMDDVVKKSSNGMRLDLYRWSR
jgi:hypothetical protein